MYLCSESAMTLVYCIMQTTNSFEQPVCESLWYDFSRLLRPLPSRKWNAKAVVCLEKQQRIQILLNSHIGLFTTMYMPTVQYQYMYNVTSQAFHDVILPYHIIISWGKKQHVHFWAFAMKNKKNTGIQKVYTFFCLWVYIYCFFLGFFVFFFTIQ